MDSAVSTSTYFSTTVKPDGTVSNGFEETLRLLPKEGRIKRRGDGYILSEDWEMLTNTFMDWQARFYPPDVFISIKDGVCP